MTIRLQSGCLPSMGGPHVHELLACTILCRLVPIGPLGFLEIASAHGAAALGRDSNETTPVRLSRARLP